MSSGYVVTLDHVESPVSPTVEADALYGDNGPGNGPEPEYVLVTASSTDSGRTTWNPDFLSDGSWDSGPVGVSMTLVPDGHGNDVITWSVNGETALTQTIPAISAIAGVEIVAGTQLNASVTWSSTSVTFSDGTSSDSYSGSDPAVDTTTAADSAAEQELFVTPTSATNTSVTVSGNVEFTYPAGTYPNPADLFAGIYIFG